ncbi:hypothetical protein PQX77_010402 [Marasmius sp. AFHP31]|nr:hypothetical protein PQX77_010402 [Marasmius sp. AFHP31]
MSSLLCYTHIISTSLASKVAHRCSKRRVDGKALALKSAVRAAHSFDAWPAQPPVASCFPNVDHRFINPDPPTVTVNGHDISQLRTQNEQGYSSYDEQLYHRQLGEPPASHRRNVLLPELINGILRAPAQDTTKVQPGATTDPRIVWMDSLRSSVTPNHLASLVRRTVAVINAQCSLSLANVGDAETPCVWVESFSVQIPATLKTA